MLNVDRWASPDGERILLVDKETGETWLMRRLPPGEAREMKLHLLPTWRKLSPLDHCKPAGPPKGGRKAGPTLALM